MKKARQICRGKETAHQAIRQDLKQGVLFITLIKETKSENNVIDAAYTNLKSSPKITKAALSSLSPVYCPH